MDILELSTKAFRAEYAQLSADEQTEVQARLVRRLDTLAQALRDPILSRGENGAQYEQEYIRLDDLHKELHRPPLDDHLGIEYDVNSPDSGIGL